MKNSSRRRSLDDEREYLEGLLSSRFNFYFIFAGAAVAGSTQLDNTLEKGVLFSAATVISFFFWRSLFRTSDLISFIIKEIDKNPFHPLKKARDKSNTRKLLPEANHYFGQKIPVFITIVFAGLATKNICSAYSHGFQDDTESPSLECKLQLNSFDQVDLDSASGPFGAEILCGTTVK